MRAEVMRCLLIITAVTAAIDNVVGRRATRLRSRFGRTISLQRDIAS